MVCVCIQLIIMCVIYYELQLTKVDLTINLKKKTRILKIRN